LDRPSHVAGFELVSVPDAVAMKTTFHILDGSNNTLFALIKIRECLDKGTGWVGANENTPEGGLYIECDDQDAATVRELINDSGIDIADVKHH
jgi:hypothetical protein